ncbi:MAG: carotenoid oxygenase family protein [Fischerella sp. CENA71]|nr:carotenoid oxygenase family protein [Fischerella sp. CENA71]
MKAEFWFESWNVDGSKTSFHRQNIHPYIKTHTPPSQLKGKRLLPKVPLSIMDANRDEIPDVTMQIVEGNLPNDLQGHVFLVAPAGTVDSQGLPYKNGNTCLNGDGMIYRLDFNQPGEVRLKQRLVTPPDYIADKVTQNTPLLRFRNHGLIRFSFLLGSRNELNTGLLPMKFPGESNERLLVTYDAGRPYEVDTQTLELVTPVGAMDEWEAAIDFPNYPFKPILSTAHPVFDTYKHQMFTVNYARPLRKYLGDIISKLNQEKEKEQEPEKNQWLSVICELLEKVWNRDSWNNDFVYLMRWDGIGDLERWQLIHPDGSPVTIRQSMHQIGVTEDYVVLMDTAFTTGIEQIINNFPDLPLVDERKLARIEPSPDSTIYIIRRDDLQEGNKTVLAQKVVIPLEAAHFLVDYENPGNKVTLHAAHICAWDVAEWLRKSDRSPYDRLPVSPCLSGTQQSPMDISRMGRYVIDVNNLSIEEKVVIDHPDCTWGVGLFAYLDRLPSSGMTPKKLDNIYWVSFGLWQELTTEFMREQYEDYRYRKVPLDKVLQLAKEGKPSCLFRLNTTSTESMRIDDYYQFPPGHIALSPQFIPRSFGEESSTNGYIMCTVFTPDRDEIWIFDAENLNVEKPLCKLYHPQLNFGLSLHTAWLQNLSSAQDKYKVAVEKDYPRSTLEKLLNFVDDLSSLTDSFTPSGGKDLKTEVKEEIQNLFEQQIYQSDFSR